MCFNASDQVCLSVKILPVCSKCYQVVICKHPNQLGKWHFDGPVEVCDLSSLECWALIRNKWVVFLCLFHGLIFLFSVWEHFCSAFMGLMLFEILNWGGNLERMFSLVSVSILAATILICISELECALGLLDAISSWFLAKAFWHVLEQWFSIPHLVSSFRGAGYCYKVPDITYTLTSHVDEGRKHLWVLASILFLVNFFRSDCVPLAEKLSPQYLVALLKSFIDLLGMKWWWAALD